MESTDATQADITPLVEIMARLRHPENGCAWDIKQDFSTIAPYTIEEAYEVVDAIERKDIAALSDELGDLLLQVVYHSRIAEELGHFALPDVIKSICNKMIRRHPHVFGPEGMTSPGWEELKASERSESQNSDTDDVDKSALAHVAKALPALLRAEKIQKRAARIGFDWPDSGGVYAKIEEELAEVKAASSLHDQSEEIGDLLFTVVNLARHMGVDAEQALRAANCKFERRFRLMELNIPEHVTDFKSLSLDEMELLWQQAKAEART